MRKLLIILCMCFSVGNCFSSDVINVIPMPQNVKLSNGLFKLDKNTKFVFLSNHEQLTQAVAVFRELCLTSTGFPLEISSQNISKNAIVCKIDKTLHKEGYKLQIGTKLIQITASDPIGVFYALQTIRQMLPAQIESPLKTTTDVSWTIPCATISDMPAFSYRGMHLDVSRHFMSVEFVKKYIDMLAFHKQNVFHWHLTDDQGWRIEIKKYPKLTEVGAKRRMEIKGHKNDPDWTWNVGEYGGYYTQDEIKDVIEYAKKRYVTIIPEIELPGHALAALSAYPELSCSGGTFEVVGRWGVFPDIFCSREETIVFLQNVVSEVADLFPGQYIHLGGDEAPKTRWKRCKACQDRMLAEDIKSETQLQTYFVNRIEEVLKDKGKKIICWDDAVDAEIPKTTTIMSWRGEEGGIKAAKQGNDVIMNPHRMVYFDYYQGDKNTEPLAAQGTFLPIEKVYSYLPIPAELTQEEAAHIIGVQANIWTEYIYNEKQVEYMAFPRIAAIAEVAWTNSKTRDFDLFSKRLKSVLQHYDVLDINYRKLDK